MTLNADPYRGAPSAALYGNVMCTLSMVTWAMSFPLAELLLQSWHPMFLGTVRASLAVAIMIPIWLLIEGPRAAGRLPWWRGLKVGAFGFGIATVSMLIAQKMTDPVTVALIAAAAPVIASTVELRQRTRRLTAGFVTGLLVTVAGGAIAASHGNAGGQFGLGAVIAVLSVCLWTWASYAAIRELPDATPLGRSCVTFVGATLALWAGTGFAVVLGLDLLPSAAFQWWQMQTLFAYAVIGMAFSQVLWLAAVSRLGVALASFHMNLTPFYVMLTMLALGAGWHWPQAYGAALVGAGVILAQQKPRKRAV